MATDEANETAAPEASLSTSAMTTSPADKSDEASAGTDTPVSGAPAGTVCVQPCSSVFSRLRIGDFFRFLAWNRNKTKYDERLKNFKMIDNRNVSILAFS